PLLTQRIGQVPRTEALEYRVLVRAHLTDRLTHVRSDAAHRGVRILADVDAQTGPVEAVQFFESRLAENDRPSGIQTRPAQRRRESARHDLAVVDRVAQQARRRRGLFGLLLRRDVAALVLDTGRDIARLLRLLVHRRTGRRLRRRWCGSSTINGTRGRRA